MEVEYKLRCKGVDDNIGGSLNDLYIHKIERPSACLHNTAHSSSGEAEVHRPRDGTPWAERCQGRGRPSHYIRLSALRHLSDICWAPRPRTPPKASCESAGRPVIVWLQDVRERSGERGTRLWFV